MTDHAREAAEIINPILTRNNASFEGDIAIIQSAIDAATAELRAENERLKQLDGDDAHPENRCMKCGGRNITWFADSQLWNATLRRDDGSDEWPILCPICFAKLAEERGHAPDAWKLLQESELNQLQAEARQLRRAFQLTDGVDFEEEHFRANTTPDELRDIVYGMAIRLAASVAEAQQLRELASYAIAIMSNVDGGDFKQSDEWVAAFRKWQEQYATTRKDDEQVEAELGTGINQP